MYVTKTYKRLISKKLPNGTILSMEYETTLGEEGADEVELFNKAKNSVMRDIREDAKTDPSVKSLWEGMIDGLKAEMRMRSDAD